MLGKNLDPQQVKAVRAALMTETESDEEKFNILNMQKISDLKLFHKTLSKENTTLPKPRQFQKTSIVECGGEACSSESTSDDEVVEQPFCEINTKSMKSSPPSTPYCEQYKKGINYETSDRKANATGTVIRSNRMESRQPTAPSNYQIKNAQVQKLIGHIGSDLYKELQNMMRKKAGSVLTSNHNVSITKDQVPDPHAKKLPSNCYVNEEEVMTLFSAETAKLKQGRKFALKDTRKNIETREGDESSTGTEDDRVLTASVARLKAMKQQKARQFPKKHIKAAERTRSKDKSKLDHNKNTEDSKETDEEGEDGDDEFERDYDDGSEYNNDKSEYGDEGNEGDENNGADGAYGADGGNERWSANENDEEKGSSSEADEGDQCDEYHYDNSKQKDKIDYVNDHFKGQSYDSDQSADGNKTVGYGDHVEGLYEGDNENFDKRYTQPITSGSSDDEAIPINKYASDDINILRQASQLTFIIKKSSRIGEKSDSYNEASTFKSRKESHIPSYKNTHSTTTLHTDVSQHSYASRSTYSAAGGKHTSYDDDHSKSSKHSATCAKSANHDYPCKHLEHLHVAACINDADTSKNLKCLSFGKNSKEPGVPNKGSIEKISTYQYLNMKQGSSKKPQIPNYTPFDSHKEEIRARSDRNDHACVSKNRYVDNPSHQIGKPCFRDAGIGHQPPSRVGSVDDFYDISVKNLEKGKRTSNRKNFSFSNERLREIDRHNMILMKKIQEPRSTYKFKTPTSSNHKISNSSSTTKVTNSAVNRRKQQRQIDLDNMVLKRKIEALASRKSLH